MPSYLSRSSLRYFEYPNTKLSSSSLLPISIDNIPHEKGCEVTVSPAAVPVTGVIVSLKTASIAVGSSQILAAAIATSNATNKNVAWSSSNPAVATVNASGNVSGVSVGTATISVVTQDGGFTDTCTVSVVNVNPDSGDQSQQQYCEDKYPGKTVVILPDENSYGETFGNTVIVGGGADDWIDISGGDNIFVYNRNGGFDTIVCIDVNSGDENEIHFGPGIWKEDLIFVSSDNDLSIIILDTEGAESGRVSIADWYLEACNRMTRIVFEDESELSTEDIEWLADNPPALIFGTNSNETIRTSSKSGSAVIVYGFEGNDYIYCGNGDEVIVPGRGTNTIYARVSYEGVGKKTFVWNVGDGGATIHYDNPARVLGDNLAILRLKISICAD